MKIIIEAPMKIMFETECGATTCAVARGQWCHFFSTKNFGQTPWCHWYNCKLHDVGGWVQRCTECLDQHGGQDVVDQKKGVG
jgi:hypothetical protein